MAGLVERGQAALFVGHFTGPFLSAHHDLDRRFFQFVVADSSLVSLGSQKGRLVQQVLEVSAGETGGVLRDFGQVDFVGQGLLFDVDLQDGLTGLMWTFRMASRALMSG